MPRQPQASLFQNAQNCSITSSTINFHNHDSRSSGIHLLSQTISTSAMHDSSARDPPPRCHPDTREAALDTIDAFVEEPEPDKAVMWMNAPFGHGKSAVMQTAIETLRASGRGEQVGGGFFFGRDKEGRDKPHYLLPTILYQIAHNIPGMYEHVNNAINTDPTLPSKSIEAQLIPLLVTPFLHHYPQSTRTPTIFIDGLDECDTPAAQRSVLKMIADAVSVHHVPLRFVVASRPETHIAQYLKTSLLSSITRSFELDNDSWSMQSYFRKEFDRIYESRLDGLSAIPKPRPSDQVVRDLVCRACGQYLFASTIIRFVDDEYENPEEQLKVLLTSHPRQSPAFSSMDILYSQILSVCPTRLQSNLIDILGLINLEGAIPISGVADLLDLPPSDVVTIIRSLRSILDIGDLPTLPPHNTRFSLSSYLSPNISIRHTSLREFLSDKARAGGFWVDLDITQAKLLERSDFVLSSSISDSASSMIIHPATWKCLLRPGWSRQTGGLNASDWPRFSREFSKYQATSSPRCPPAGCRLQCSKAFCYLLGIWNKHSWIMDQIASPEDFHIVQSLVATSLRECFHSLTQESLDLFALLKYFHLTEKSTYATTLEAIANQPDISFDVALRAIDSASIFFTLETDKYYTKPSFRDVSICVDWSIMEILMDSNLIGEDIYIAHRNARILALSDCYNSLLQEIPSSDSFRRKASSVFDLPQITWDILMLKDNTDNGSGSTMEAFINRICSPRSLAVLCNSAAFDYSTSYFFVPFFFFVTTNCVRASSENVLKAFTAN
ncbi:hypothetical protein CPB83DRAFT_69141 [Crepidotus variabilis]|uniref:Nephrocystin 3-like N-terminal domain-containing protein n=1 Tax=Crepidotus variabilis TaxID=179855 RepID=A0A9P6E5N5_9AGAR|nr:hypothetical protein CPB83DRAFT_69141 [Crepidotus variabilis]